MSEHDEQVFVVNWIFNHIKDYPELDLAFSIPNGAMLGGGRIGAIRANSLKAEGMRPGVPDLFIPSARGGYFGIFIEMKTRSGELSENQKQFIYQAEKYNYRCVVAYGMEQAIAELEQYLKLPYTKRRLHGI